MNIAMIGSGSVGQVLGACFADFGPVCKPRQVKAAGIRYVSIGR